LLGRGWGRWRNKGGGRLGLWPRARSENSKNPIKFFKGRLILFTGAQIFDFAPGDENPCYATGWGLKWQPISERSHY